MERVQKVYSNPKLKSWIKQVLAVGGIIGCCYLVLYVFCFLVIM
ncbi:hypothetical protein C621_0218365 [Bacillus thuringiensis serovar aizawai str. Leapi01]|nr:hypothetical protein C621_0218365 [Bacillus thuringiensis serovar aizawai str. Leapi01]ETE92209.1 hypothetical protein C623_0226350 [Bacillus thuringiensis serovar aizawai str. Hu4-2]